MSEYIHMTHGKAEQRDELIKMLDLTFGFEQEGNKFINLLPKLYKEEYQPAENNIILDVNGDMRAAVGVYYNTLTVADEKLRLAGIGNVGVHPEHQGKGYMQFCMLLALDEMKQNMTDIAALGGARQRYEHFSFEPAGIQTAFRYTKNNVKRTLGADRTSKFTSRKLTENDTEIYAQMEQIYTGRIFHAERPAAMMYDILRTWHAVPYAAFDGDEFKGWFVFNRENDALYELFCKNEEDTEDMILAALEASGRNEIRIHAPEFETALYKYLALNCEYFDIGHAEQFSILCYERVLRAFLKLKASYKKLPDGEFKMLILGEKLPEQLKITVKDNNVTVEETDEKPDIILKHLEAMRLIGSHYSEMRNDIPAECQAWFPLPIYGYGIDNV